VKRKRLPVVEVVRPPQFPWLRIGLVESPPCRSLDVEKLIAACGVKKDSDEAKPMRRALEHLSWAIGRAVAEREAAVQGADRLTAAIGLLREAHKELVLLPNDAVRPLRDAINEAIWIARRSFEHFRMTAPGRRRKVSLVELRDQAADDLAAIYYRYTDPDCAITINEFLKTVLEPHGLKTTLLRDADEKPTRLGRRVVADRTNPIKR
jgi:hypothetical protein